jgi:hypothetical protein
MVPVRVGGYCDSFHRCQFGDASTPDSTAASDAPSDAPSQALFEIGFVSEWRRGSTATSVAEQTWVRVVNTGDTPLDLSDGMVTNVSLNGPPGFDTTGTAWLGSTTVLEPGMSAGALRVDAAQLIIASGIVSEPAQDTTSDLLRLDVSSFPGTWIGVDLEITVQIANARATLATRVVNSGTGTVTPMAAARAVSTAVP